MTRQKAKFAKIRYVKIRKCNKGTTDKRQALFYNPRIESKAQQQSVTTSKRTFFLNMTDLPGPSD